MSDYIVRATAGNGSIRTFAATTRDLVQHAREIHHTSPVASAALGRMLTAAAMMGSMLKGEKDIVTLQIRGEGPLQGLVVTSDSHARVKGYVFNPNVEIPDLYPGKLNVGGAIGNGYMSVIKDIGMREPYAGRIELVTGGIADDLTYYFAQSEQTPSAVGLGVLVETDTSIRRAGGFIIQLLPDATDEMIEKLEKKLATLPYVSDLLDMGKAKAFISTTAGTFCGQMPSPWQRPLTRTGTLRGTPFTRPTTRKPAGSPSRCPTPSMMRICSVTAFRTAAAASAARQPSTATSSPFRRGTKTTRCCLRLRGCAKPATSM